jgi:hypothetical protein
MIKDWIQRMDDENMKSENWSWSWSWNRDWRGGDSERKHEPESPPNT